NSPLQGSAADLIKIAMIRIHAAVMQAGLKTKMLLQVHDELFFEIPESERTLAGALVKREMEGVASLRVPLVVSIGAGKDWVDARRGRARRTFPDRADVRGLWRKRSARPTGYRRGPDHLHVEPPYREFRRRREGMRFALTGGVWLHRHKIRNEPMVHLVSSDKDKLLALGPALHLHPRWLQYKPLKNPDTGVR